MSRFELHPCGRLSTPGCFANGPPPSVLSSIRTLGRRIGPTAVILVGYNDDPHVYAAGIDSVLHAMHRRGVKQVLWLTLRPVYDGRVSTQYRITNERDSRRVSPVPVDDGRPLGRVLVSAQELVRYGRHPFHLGGSGAVRDLRSPAR